MVNVAIAGLGFMGATHLKAYQTIPNARIVAIFDAAGKHLDGDFSDISGNLGKSDPLRLDMTRIKAYRTLAELLADPDVEVVDVCTPTAYHPEVAIQALGAGKHVLCEKPLARTSQLGREIQAAAAQAKGMFMPCMCLRFWPEWAWLKQAIVNETYGRPLAARFRRVTEPPSWGQQHFHVGAASGGALLDLHIHDTDFVLHCFGRPRHVYSTGYTQFSGAIDHVVTQYAVSSGAIVHAEGSWAMTPGFGFNMSYTVNFEKATADYDIARGADALRLTERGQASTALVCPGPDGFAGELQYFLNCVESGQPPSVVTAADAVGALEICEAEERSIASGQIVVL